MTSHPFSKWDKVYTHPHTRDVLAGIHISCNIALTSLPPRNRDGPHVQKSLTGIKVTLSLGGIEECFSKTHSLHFLAKLS